MTQINWGLQRGPNSFDNAFGQGLQIGQAFKQKERQNALAAYAANPDADGALEGLAQHHPQIAMQERGRMAEQQRTQQFVELRRRALAGDKQAQIELAAQDTAAYNNMTEQQRKELDAQDDMLAQAALQVMSAPLEQRSAIWDEQARNLGADEYVGQYNEGMMNTIVNRAGIQERLQKMMQPDYMAIPEGGTLVNTRDPQAIQQFGQGGGQIPPPPPGFEIDGDGSGNAAGNFQQ